MLNDNILYIIIEKLDTKTLFKVDQIGELKHITTSICQKRIKATKTLQKFYRNRVKYYISNKKKIFGGYDERLQNLYEEQRKNRYTLVQLACMNRPYTEKLIMNMYSIRSGQLGYPCM